MYFSSGPRNIVYDITPPPEATDIVHDQIFSDRHTYLDLTFVEGMCVDQETGQEVPPNTSFQKIRPATGKKECGSRVCIVCDEDKGTACYSGQSYVFNKTISLSI